MRQAWVTRAEFEEMTRDGRVTDDSTLAAYALLVIAERRGDVELLGGPGYQRRRVVPYEVSVMGSHSSAGV